MVRYAPYPVLTGLPSTCTWRKHAIFTATVTDNRGELSIPSDHVALRRASRIGCPNILSSEQFWSRSVTIISNLTSRLLLLLTSSWSLRKLGNGLVMSFFETQQTAWVPNSWLLLRLCGPIGRDTWAYWCTAALHGSQVVLDIKTFECMKCSVPIFHLPWKSRSQASQGKMLSLYTHNSTTRTRAGLTILCVSRKVMSSLAMSLFNVPPTPFRPVFTPSTTTPTTTDWNQTEPVRDSALEWTVWPSGRSDS